jgi:hypothetical protein
VSQRERKEGRKEAKDGVGSGEGEVQREAYGTPPFLNARGDGYVGFSTFLLFSWLVSTFCSLWVFLPSFFLSFLFLFMDPPGGVL